jgi:hypothetical protein
MKVWSMLHRAGAWAEMTGVIMQTTAVIWLTAAPTAGTEYGAVPLQATVMTLDTSSLKTPAIILDTRPGVFSLPWDWADRTRYVTPS